MVRKSIENETTVFPMKLRFPATFPNVPVERKVIISNSREDAEDVRISLKGDPEFTVSVDRIRIVEGETAAIVVRFCPKSVSLFNGTLVVTGREVVRVPMTGSGITSPLEIPPASADVWQFPRRRTERLVRLGNRSLYLPLRVVLATNCSAFSVTPQEVEIAPASWAEVSLVFTPKTAVAEAPCIFIQCAQTGDSVEIPLTFRKAKSVVVVDFGTTSVNSRVKQELKLDRNEAVPDVPWPFSAGHGSDSNSIMFEFCAHNVNEFECKIELENAIVKLIGRTVIPPYRIFFPPSFPEAPITVSNLTYEPLKLILSAKPASVALSKSVMELRPNQTGVVHVLSDKLDFDAFTLVVEWDTEMMDHVIDYHIHDTTQNVSGMTEIEASELDTSGTFLNTSKKRDTITASTSFIVFPKVSSRHISTFSFTVSCDDDFEIKTPDWIEIYEAPQANVPTQLHVKSLRSSLVSGNVICKAHTEELVIPAIAYSGSSQILIDSPLDVRTTSQTQGSVTLDVQNVGRRSGFVVFTVPDEYCVDIFPKAAVIEPNSICAVRFVTPLKGHSRVPIIALSGDELLRQLLAKVCPSDFFAKFFENIDTVSEIDSISGLIHKLNPRDIVSLFKKHLVTSQLTLRCPDKAVPFKQVTISPQQLEFVASEPASVSILNLSPRPLEFSASCKSKHAKISPGSGIAPPYAESIVTVEMNKPEITSVELKCAGETFTVPVSPLAPTKVKLETSVYEDRSLSLISSSPHTGVRSREAGITNRGGFSVNKGNVDFSTCELGRSLRKSVIISNDEPKPMRISLRSTNPDLFSCEKTATLPASGHLVIEVEFHPSSVGTARETLHIENEDNNLEVGLIGECIEESVVSVSALANGEFQFPACLPGTIRRVNLRITNRKRKPVYVTARTSVPFSCPQPEFDVDPLGSVICPIRFTPMSPGRYNATLTLRSSLGSVTTLRLVGTCLS